MQKTAEERKFPIDAIEATILAPEDFMPPIQAQLMGIELYFDNLENATKFYTDTLGLTITEEQAGHHAQFESAGRFICLERKGVESYPSKDKAVLFFAVPSLESAVAAIGREKFVHIEPAWAVLHDPEGHNVLLLESATQQSR